MPDILPKEKYNQKVYVFREDWELIDEYFSLIKGHSPLTKTQAIREVIHAWVRDVIRPALLTLQDQEKTRSKNAPDLDLKI